MKRTKKNTEKNLLCLKIRNVVFAPLIGHSHHNNRKIVGVCCQKFLRFRRPKIIYGF